tara:strand:- start:5375 stop:5572 length:198 start_codon:yes stop_codon:yes gene_type:complete
MFINRYDVLSTHNKKYRLHKDNIFIYEKSNDNLTYKIIKIKTSFDEKVVRKTKEEDNQQSNQLVV